MATNHALEIITEWGRGVKLTFGAPKTKLIAFTPKAKAAQITMGNQLLKFEMEIKYLGVIIDEKLLFNKHLQYTINKAQSIFNRLCLFTRPTWGAHPENIKTIYHQVIEPIITYAAGIWGDAVRKKSARKKLDSMQRGFAIKTIKCFRTVSTVAALALAQYMPLDLKILEVCQVERTRLTGITHHLPRDL